ncbi:MAG: GntR family transcriptional regulator [Candidatus Xenobiia bacterium LiM19]
MNFKIDPSSGLPIYLQLIDQIKYHISVGTLKAEDQLPSVRKLSTELRINPNTIAKAFNIMETDGIVYTKRGEGTFISTQAELSSNKDRLEVLTGLVDQVIETALTLKVPMEELQKLVESRYSEKQDAGSD